MRNLLIAAAALALSSGATASVFNEVEGNNSLATANSIDGYFALDAGPTPQVTINANGESGGTDIFKFTVTTAGSQGTFDINGACPVSGGGGGCFDSYLRLLNSSGGQLTANDDSDGVDSYLSYTFATTGSYFIQVLNCCYGGFNGSGEQDYQLVVSLQNGIQEVPEPAMLGLFGLGAIGLGASRRRRA